MMYYLIVDDEPLARKLIRSHASKIEGLEWVGDCSNAFEASTILRSRRVDLVFLDIQMPEVTGLQLAHSLKNPPSIILTTAHRDFAPEAFELDVVDYLLKPISFERLLKAVNKFFDRVSINGNLAPDEASERSDFVFLRAERKIHKLPINEILYFESLDDFVKVHLKAKTLITRENISTLEGTLPKTVFVRIHRSFIVNARFVATLSNDGVGIGGRELPFGRVFKRAALSRLSTSDK